jgi:hypothetical protein
MSLRISISYLELLHIFVLCSESWFFQNFSDVMSHHTANLIAFSDQFLAECLSKVPPKKVVGPFELFAHKFFHDACFLDPSKYPTRRDSDGDASEEWVNMTWLEKYPYVSI